MGVCEVWRLNEWVERRRGIKRSLVVAITLTLTPYLPPQNSLAPETAQDQKEGSQRARGAKRNDHASMQDRTADLGILRTSRFTSFLVLSWI